MNRPSILVLPLLAATAFAVSEPLDVWVLGETFPSADAEDAPTDGVVAVRGIPAGPEYGSSFEDVLSLTVWVNGVEATGGTLSARLAREVIWRGAHGFPAGAEVEVALAIHNELDIEVEGELDRRYRFRVGADHGAPPTESPIAELRAEALPDPAPTCLRWDEPEESCVSPVCLEEGPPDPTPQLRVELEVAAPEARVLGFGTICVQLTDAPDAEPVQAFPLFNCYDLGTEPALSMERDLGPVTDWATDEVCARVTTFDALRREAPGEIRCVRFARPPGHPDRLESPGDSDTTPAFDAETAAGCSSTGGSSAPLLLLLLGVLRRRGDSQPG